MNTSADDTEPQMRLGIYTRAILLVGIVLAAATAGVTFWNVQDNREHLAGMLERRVVVLANHQAISVANSLWDLNRDAANTVLRGMSQDPDFVSAQVKDEKGRVFAEVTMKTVPKDLTLRFTQDVFIDVPGQRLVIGTLTLTLSRERSFAAQRQALVDALVLGTVLLIVMIVAVSLVLRMVMKPLATISNRMLAVAGGDLANPVPYTDRADQIGEVARAVDTFREVSVDRAQAQSALKEAHDEMERRVEQRTEELRRAESLFRSVIAASPAEIFLRDKAGVMLLVNGAWEEAQGIREKDAVGKTDIDLLPNELPDRYREQDKIVLRTGKSLDRQVELTFGGTTRFFHTIKFPLFDSDGSITGIGGITSDVTEHRRAEEQLRQAHKMEAVGQLTGGVAHDFNNLLAVILGHAEIIEDRLGGNDTSVKTIIRAAERGSELTQRLLAYSRRQPLKPQSIDLKKLIGDVHQLLRRTLGETIDIEISVVSSIWDARADPGQLENALLNLALNARDSMPDGGKLMIEAANVTLSESDVLGDMEVAPGDYVSLSVNDTGKGMPPEVKERAFEPFFTTKDVGEGSGLGLSMVYGFAKQSRGDVTIDSGLDQGTRVDLLLPRSRMPAQDPAKNRLASTPKGCGETVLVIEDDPDVRVMTESMLRNLDYRVLSAENARVGLEILEAEPAIDLVLSDVVLPGGISGLDLAQQAKTVKPGIRVLFMSGHPERPNNSQNTLPQGSILLDKPFRIIELANHVRATLDR